MTMPITLTAAQYASFDGTLESRVAAFEAALAAHAETVDEPRPVEHEIVEAIAAAGGMDEVTIDAAPEPPVVVPPTLTAAKREATRRVNEAAGATRAEYITVVAGQEITYQVKREQAQRIIDGATYSAAAHRFIQAEIQARADAGLPVWTAAEIAADVLAEAEAWIAIGAEIERQRRARVLLIQAAETPEQAMSHAVWVWPPEDEGDEP